MIRYVCNNCDKLVCETSTCSICKERTVMEKTEVYYCEHCNIPVFDKTCSLCLSQGKYIGTDLRPVFPEERLLLEATEGTPFKYAGCSIWNTSGNNYYIDGKKIKFSVKSVVENKDANDIRKIVNENNEKNKQYVENFYKQEYVENFINANKIRLNDIVTEAHSFIKEVSKKYSEDAMFVSFSGGKDSTVTSDLVLNALGKSDIIHIYGDTTLEYPETANYLEVFKKQYPKTPMLVAKNKDQNFNELCKVIGPPSRVMRWCCTIFKTGAITRKIDATFKNKTKVLTFYGIRRSESFSRNKYERESEGAKITKQKTVSPIIDWLDFDVWLYILSKKIPFNNAYRLGFARVGCWCCPNNSNWSEFLSHVYMKDEYEEFHDILINFAKHIDKPDPDDYIKSGGWKARQGGNGLEFSKNAVLSFKPCALEENAYNFELNKPITDTLYELFKPFGHLDFNIGNKRLGEVYVLEKRTNEPLIKITGKLGQNLVKVAVLKENSVFKNPKINEMLIKNQITKFQTCIGCMACESVCKFNAIKIQHKEIQGNEKFNVDYKIDENKCVGCLECVKHFNNGCYMKKVLRTKQNKED
ncbi:MAG: phosphoadenosine phosphosulfate reductase family protein [Clostridia bacterium]|nr:phosphoadenosine phosphosulfate reductase family protein [Clostridia bacterium]